MIKESSTKIGANHKALLSRINRIVGQMGGVKKMIESERYCVDILTQLKATRSALISLEERILENHARHCLRHAAESGQPELIDEKINEIVDLLKKRG